MYALSSLLTLLHLPGQWTKRMKMFKLKQKGTVKLKIEIMRVSLYCLSFTEAVTALHLDCSIHYQKFGLKALCKRPLVTLNKITYLLDWVIEKKWRFLKEASQRLELTASSLTFQPKKKLNSKSKLS